MNLKELFDKSTAENKALTYAELEALAKEGKAKFTDLSEGNYVSRQKYDDDIKTKDTQITSLNETLATRDSDLTNLKTQLANAQTELQNAGADAGKLDELTTQLTNLQAKYAEDTGKLQSKLSAQAYEFAVRDFANGQKFSCEAAKLMFEQDMIAKNLPMENKKIMGANDYLTEYKKAHKDSFAVDKPAEPSNQPQFSTSTTNNGNQGAGGKKMTLSEMMKMKNDNPNAVISFE
jgi:chromosome segregation ATPase